MFDTAAEIKSYVEDFLTFAKAHPELKFLVTKIGCDIMGFTPAGIAPLFQPAIDENVENVYLPENFLTEKQPH
jgi:hypothetical protein